MRSRGRWLVAWIGAVLALGRAPVVRAQESIPQNAAQLERLRQLVEERFSARLQTELDLNDDQLQKLRGTSQVYGDKRRALAEENKTLRQSLNHQMRPGIAADQNEVDRLTRRISEVGAEYAKTYNDEVQAMDYLTPVQRARYVQMRERFLERLRDLQAQRQQRNGGMFPRLGGGRAGAFKNLQEPPDE